MDNKPSLSETLGWLKIKLEEKGNYSTMFQNIFDHEEGTVARKVLSFNFNEDGIISITISYRFSNWTADRSNNNNTMYQFNIKSLNRVSQHRVKNNETIKRDNAMNTIEVHSFNKEKNFECTVDKAETILVESVPVPITDDSELIERIKNAFEYLIINFGDNRILPKTTEPF